MNRTDQMIEIVSAYGAAKNRHDLAAALERCAEDFYLEVVPFDRRTGGKEESRIFLEQFLEAFPDYVGEVESVATGEDVVILTWVLRGRFLGMTPTGNEVAVRAVSAFTLRGDRITGERVYYDVATMCRQAGLPLPAASLSMSEERPPSAAEDQRSSLVR
jgi:steroid delta-isomerase-like uncharacterized protein